MPPLRLLVQNTSPNIVIKMPNTTASLLISGSKPGSESAGAAVTVGGQHQAYRNCAGGQHELEGNRFTPYRNRQRALRARGSLCEIVSVLSEPAVHFAKSSACSPSPRFTSPKSSACSPSPRFTSRNRQRALRARDSLREIVSVLSEPAVHFAKSSACSPSPRFTSRNRQRALRARDSLCEIVSVLSEPAIHFAKSSACSPSPRFTSRNRQRALRARGSLRERLVLPGNVSLLVVAFVE